MKRTFVCIALGLMTHSVVDAQSLGMQPIDAPSEAAAIPLGTGGVEGAVAPESWFSFNKQATDALMHGDFLTESHRRDRYVATRHCAWQCHRAPWRSASQCA